MEWIMSYQIFSREYHQDALSRCHERLSQYAAEELSECSLSLYGTEQMVRFHTFALGALEIGACNGINGPASYFPALMDGQERVNAKLINGTFGMVWILEDGNSYGRKFIPFAGAGKSRVQSHLGLREIEVVGPASPYVEVSCGGRGMPLSFRLRPMEQQKEAA
jgi:hypothetical protein